MPLAAPGERVRVRIERAQGRVAWGELTAIERPSPVRVTPPCPLFGSCGGCQWQQASIEAQREAKRAIAARALKCELPPTVAAGPPFGYRDRAKLAVGPQGTLGFRARRSHDVVDVPACPLFGPELARALPLLRGGSARARAGGRAGGSSRHRGRARERPPRRSDQRRPRAARAGRHGWQHRSSGRGGRRRRHPGRQAAARSGRGRRRGAGELAAAGSGGWLRAGRARGERGAGGHRDGSRR